MLDLAKAQLFEFANDGGQGEIVESSVAGLALQPGAIAPHAEGLFGIAERFAGLESSPERIKGDFPKRRLGDIDGKHEPSAAAQEPLNFVQKTVVGFGRPTAKLL